MPRMTSKPTADGAVSQKAPASRVGATAGASTASKETAKSVTSKATAKSTASKSTVKSTVKSTASKATAKSATSKTTAKSTASTVSPKPTEAVKSTASKATATSQAVDSKPNVSGEKPKDSKTATVKPKATVKGQSAEKTVTSAVSSSSVSQAKSVSNEVKPESVKTSQKGLEGNSEPAPKSVDANSVEKRLTDILSDRSNPFGLEFVACLTGSQSAKRRFEGVDIPTVAKVGYLVKNNSVENLFIPEDKYIFDGKGTKQSNITTILESKGFEGAKMIPFPVGATRALTKAQFSLLKYVEGIGGSIYVGKQVLKDVDSKIAEIKNAIVAEQGEDLASRTAKLKEAKQKQVPFIDKNVASYATAKIAIRSGKGADLSSKTFSGWNSFPSHGFGVSDPMKKGLNGRSSTISLNANFSDYLVSVFNEVKENGVGVISSGIKPEFSEIFGVLGEIKAVKKEPKIDISDSDKAHFAWASNLRNGGK